MGRGPRLEEGGEVADVMRRSGRVGLALVMGEMVILTATPRTVRVAHGPCPPPRG